MFNNPMMNFNKIQYIVYRISEKGVNTDNTNPYTNPLAQEKYSAAESSFTLIITSLLFVLVNVAHFLRESIAVTKQPTLIGPKES